MTSQTPKPSCTPREVFAHHGQALAAGDLDEIVLDYAEDSVLISPAGVARGRDGIREVFAKFLEWAAASAINRVDDGVDTFLFGDGMIRAQTVRYTPAPKG